MYVYISLTLCCVCMYFISIVLPFWRNKDDNCQTCHHVADAVVTCEIKSLIRDVYRLTPWSWCLWLSMRSCVLVVMFFCVSMDPCGLIQINENEIKWKRNFRGLLQLTNIFRRVQCRWNNNSEIISELFHRDWNDFYSSFRRGTRIK